MDHHTLNRAFFGVVFYKTTFACRGIEFLVCIHWAGNPKSFIDKTHGANGANGMPCVWNAATSMTCPRLTPPSRPLTRPLTQCVGHPPHSEDESPPNIS